MRTDPPSPDRHASGIDAIRRDVVEAPAVTDRATRASVMAGDYPDALRTFLVKVRDASYRITGEDIAALRSAGFGEDEIYEMTLAAAVGIAYERLESARRAMKSAS